MPLAALLERRPAAAPAGLAVLVRAAGPALAARLARLPGIRLVEEEAAAAVVVTDQPLAAGGPPAPMLPTLILAEGPAALAGLRAGAQAVLPPDAAPGQVAAGLAALGRGLAVLPPGPARRPGRARAPAVPVEAGLTRREREVLDLLAAGASNKVIARRLGLSFHTAKAHVAAVLQKLGAGSRADAVARGRGPGWCCCSARVAEGRAQRHAG